MFESCSVGYILLIEPTITQRAIAVLETVVTNLDCVSTSRSVVQVPSEQGKKCRWLGFEPPETVVSSFWKSATPFLENCHSCNNNPSMLSQFLKLRHFQKMT